MYVNIFQAEFQFMSSLSHRWITTPRRDKLVTCTDKKYIYIYIGFWHWYILYLRQNRSYQYAVWFDGTDYLYRRNATCAPQEIRPKSFLWFFWGITSLDIFFIYSFYALHLMHRKRLVAKWNIKLWHWF